MESSPPAAPPAYTPATTRLIAVATVLVALVILRMTRQVTLPIVGGLLVAAMAWPLLRRFERLLPRALALLATVLVVVAIVLGLFAVLGWSGARVSEQILERRDRLTALHRQASEAAARVGVHVPDLPSATDSSGGAAAGAGAGGSTGMNGFAMRVGRALFSGASGIALALGFMALALAEARDARRKVRQRFAPDRAERIVGIVGEVASHVQRYVLVKSVTSLIAGAATFLIATAFGLDLAYVWGLLAFLLEYVPTVGSVLAVIPPALFAAVEFDGLARPVALTAALTVAQLFLGNYVDPRVEGRMLALSPFVVLASIILWAWVWGAPGALLGVPLTIAATTVARHFDGTRWLWAVLTSPSKHEDTT
jgi:AI-2 transport protein TqsA